MGFYLKIWRNGSRQSLGPPADKGRALDCVAEELIVTELMLPLSDDCGATTAMVKLRPVAGQDARFAETKHTSVYVVPY
jgi:hypothetical protein